MYEDFETFVLALLRHKKGLLCKMSQGEYVLPLLSHSSKWRGYETTAKKSWPSFTSL